LQEGREKEGLGEHKEEKRPQQLHFRRPGPEIFRALNGSVARYRGKKRKRGRRKKREMAEP